MLFSHTSFEIEVSFFVGMHVVRLTMIHMHVCITFPVQAGECEKKMVSAKKNCS